jgi:nucleotide-binding universal stress UspA family protein
VAPRLADRVQRDQHDLLIKTAERCVGGRGFKATDLTLVQKCECPVWLHRPLESRSPLRVAVAVDPETLDEEERLLALSLLRAGRKLADHFEGPLHVVSCWDYPFEEYLRHNTWFSVAASELAGVVAGAEGKHQIALEAMLKEAGIPGALRIHHLRGDPAARIPEWVEESGIGLLVMGSRGRGGLTGLLMGNTSEDLLRQLTCSVVTVKARREG